jgi:hypothetical protein
MDRLRQDGDLETGISPNFLFVTGRQRSKSGQQSRFVMASTPRINFRV